ncbi:DUF2892 domain-containing protein [uncultured Fluviicola sp.]|uniref:YgaP family membrane protein n=1 Tax=uncultured Fluviicola sp. TaxID=463303 RepID=UPI0025EF62CC|nr:DUF2892 domain-containing protein [uncultured Fluviicola sp.]
MKANMHLIDRIARIVISIAIALLYVSGYFTGTLAIITLVVAVIFTITGLIGFCPLYALVGLSTKKKEKR